MLVCNVAVKDTLPIKVVAFAHALYTCLPRRPGHLLTVLRSLDASLFWLVPH